MDELVDMIARVMRTGRAESLTGDAAQRCIDEANSRIYAKNQLKRKLFAPVTAGQRFTLPR
jgi:hypothetical protein